MEDVTILKLWICNKNCIRRDLNFKNIKIKKISPSNITIDNIVREFNIQKRYYNKFYSKKIKEYFKVILKINTMPTKLISYLEYSNFINDFNILNGTYDSRILTKDNINILKKLLLTNFSKVTPNIYYYNSQNNLLEYMNDLELCNFNIDDLNYLILNIDNYYLVNNMGLILKDSFDLYNEIFKNNKYEQLMINNDIIIFKKIN